ncbi:MAG: transcription antitermination factor NusB [Actinobacteria bacterium]|nr:transcription antitermination factor NusB [Actinomycetota bacterium]MTA89427.1 transcription antitermination factor NusB [Actinomycetota bacterium]
MSARTKARKRALDALFAADLTKDTALDALKRTEAESRERESQAAIFDYAETLVNGYLSNQDRIDSRLQGLAEGWTLERMPNVDRAILRIAAWELLYNEEIPSEVAIAEAVALASELSTEESPKFINGILARLAKDRQGL